MKWLPDGPCAFRRDDDRYMVARAPQHGFPATITLARLGVVRTTWKGERFWESSELIATVLVKNEDGRRAAWDQLMERAK